jgi:hypothetical protein
MRRGLGISIAGLCLFAACVKDSGVAPQPVITGSPATYSVSNGIPVHDSVTHGTFVFPAGGSGTLTIARLTSSPTIDSTVFEGYKIEYSGPGPLGIRLSMTDSTELDFRIYCVPGYSTSDGLDVGPVFVPVPGKGNASKDSVTYMLGYPGTAPDGMPALAKTLTSNSLVYWGIWSRSKKYSQQMRLDTLGKLQKMIMAELIDSLPIYLSQQAQLGIAGRYVLAGTGYYSGAQTGYVPWLSYQRWIGDVGPYFVFNVKPGAVGEVKPSGIAHESGHYLSHVLLGDDFFANKVVNVSLLKHNLTDPRQGRPMSEEYAHFADYCIYNSVDSKKEIIEVNEFFKTKRGDKAVDNAPPEKVRPEFYDWPSMEGFGTALLIRMTMKQPTIKSHFDLLPDTLPVIGATVPEMMGVLFGRGPATTTELYNDLQGYLDSIGGDAKYKLPALAERLGWSYHGEAIVIDTLNKPVEFAKVQNIYQVSDVEQYQTLYNTTESDGRCILPRLFPGKSILRVWFNYDSAKKTFGDSANFPLIVEPLQATTKAVPLCTLKISLSAPPVITNITPASQSPGKQVVITGKNFGSVQGTVTFGGVAADTIVTWDSVIVVVKIPAGGVSGNVYVITKDKKTSTGDPYTVLSPTVVTSLSPAEPVEGDTILIHGTGFGPNTGGGNVKFTTMYGDMRSSLKDVIAWSDTLVRVKVLREAISGSLQVGGAGTSPLFPFTVKMTPGLYKNVGVALSSLRIRTIDLAGKDTESVESPGTGGYQTCTINYPGDSSVVAQWDSTALRDTSAVLTWGSSFRAKIDYGRAVLRNIRSISFTTWLYKGISSGRLADTVAIDSVPLYSVSPGNSWMYGKQGSQACGHLVRYMHEEVSTPLTGTGTSKHVVSVSCDSTSEVGVWFLKQ